MDARELKRIDDWGKDDLLRAKPGITRGGRRFRILVVPVSYRLPFENDLAIRVTRKHRDGVTVECVLRPELLNSQGVLHGGVTASIADEAAWHAMLHQYGEREATTTELKVNYLRPVTGKKVIARAYVLRAGRTLFVSRIDLFDARKNLGAVAVVTYMLLNSK